MFCIAAIGMMAVMISCGDNRSGNRKPSTRKSDSSQVVIPQDVDPGFSIGEDGELQGAPLDIIGIPMSVVYSVTKKSWNLSFRINSKNGLHRSVEIDSATASNIINDRTIVAVRVYGQEVTLLRE